MSKTDLNDAKIKFFLPIVAHKKVLDVGVVQHCLEKYSDPKWLHRAIANASRYCVGIDVDAAGVRFLQDMGFQVLHADAQDFNLGERFEVAIAGDVLEHLSNPGKFLDCIAMHHLDIDGILGLSTPNPFWWKTWLKVLIKGNAEPHPQHACWFCEVTLAQLLRRHGFEVDKVHYGTIFGSSLQQKIIRILNCVIPLPRRFKHNTIMIVARLRRMDK